MKWHGGLKVQLNKFIIPARDGDKRSASRSSSFKPRRITPFIHWIGGWVTLNLVWTRWQREKSFTSTGIKPRQSSPLSLKRNLILSFYLPTCFSTGLFPSACLTKIMWAHHFLIITLVLTYTFHLILMHLLSYRLFCLPAKWPPPLIVYSD
jgi:hypothetical protein